jgi:HPt (histidine-containing phosphotransfer) domain-containing protein
MQLDSAAPTCVLDVEGALTRFGGDKQLFSEMASIVLDDLPVALAKLQTAVQEGSSTGVRNHAHAIKGLLLGCGGTRAAQAAQGLENAGQRDDLERSGEMLAALESEVQEFARALRPYRRS